MGCDASEHDIGVLMQEGSPTVFESFQIKGNNLLKPIYKKEMLGILNVVKKWCPYPIGIHFKVKIDHDSLNYFLEQGMSSIIPNS
jgi:hypothetical protein